MVSTQVVPGKYIINSVSSKQWSVVSTQVIFAVNSSVEQRRGVNSSGGIVQGDEGDKWFLGSVTITLILVLLITLRLSH